MADTELDVLRSSAARLRGLAESLDEGDLNQPAYPKEWTNAQVLSHLGSGAVIMLGRLDDLLAGRDTPDGFAPEVWDTWNAKSPGAQRDDALAADAALLARLEAMTPDERERCTLTFGPMTLGFDGFVAMRLNEHGLHTWDIEVAGDREATLPRDVASVAVDNLEMIVRFTAQATPGGDATISVRTTDPDRGLTIAFTAEGATLTTSQETSDAGDLDLPTEAFVRLVYGRLDPDHTPAITGDGALLDRLRATFPGP